MSTITMPQESPEVQAAMLLSATLLLATGNYTSEDAAQAVRCLRAILRSAPLAPEVADADVPC
jgi:hypothetical protein